MSISINAVRFSPIGSPIFKRCFDVTPEVFSHLLSHFLHEAIHALRVVLIEAAEVAWVSEGFESSLFGPRRGKSGHDPFQLFACAMLAGGRKRGVDTEHQDAAAFATLETTVFVNRHGLCLYIGQIGHCAGIKLAVPHQYGIKRAREGDHRDWARPCFSQHLRAFVDRRAGSVDIVYEQDPFLLEVVRTGDEECLAQIFQTGLPGEGSLCVRGNRTHEVRIRERDSQVPTQTVSEQEGLIEFPLSQTHRVERDRHDEIDIEGLGEPRAHEGCQPIDQPEFAFVLEQADRFLERGNVGIQCPGFGKRWAYPSTVAA